MASMQEAPISVPTIAGLVVAIGAADVVANVAVPQSAQVPVKLAIVALFVAWAHGPARLSWDELGLDRSRLGAGLRLGGLVALVVGATVAVLVFVPATRSFFESGEVADDSNLERWLMPLVIIPLGTALFEETLFRGVLLGVLLRVLSRIGAVIVSSLLFGLWHLPAAMNDASGEGAAGGFGVVIGTIAITSVAGVLFAYLRLRSGSLAAPLLAHAAINSIAYVGAVAALHLG